MSRLFYIPLFLFATLLSTIYNARAEPASLVGDTTGKVILVQYRGLCYAIFPKHLTNQKNLSLEAGIDEKKGQAILLASQINGLDLSLAEVNGPIKKYCTQRWVDLPRDLSGILQKQTAGVVTRTQKGGIIDPISVNIVPLDTTYLVVNLINKSDRLMEGTSGSLLKIGELPIGMVIEGGEGADGKILRMDAMVKALTPFVEGERLAYGAKDANAPFRVIAWSQTPERADQNALNLSASGNNKPYVAKITDKPLDVQIVLRGDELVAISQVTILSRALGIQTSLPKQIKIFAGQDQILRARDLVANLDMGQSGNFTARFGKRWARYVTIRIESAWFPEKPVRIDAINIE